MKNTLVMLIKLSDVDSKIDALLNAQASIPEENQQIEAEIHQLKNAIAAVESEQVRLETFNRESDAFIADKKAWIEEREQIVKALKTNKEYQAALKEVAQAKKDITDRESQVTTNTTKIETLKQSASEVTTTNQAKIAERQEVLNKNAETLGGIEDQIEAERKARQGILAELEKPAIERYEFIRRRSIPALSKVENRVCGECSTLIPPQLQNQIHVSKELIICPRCKRILYLEALLGP